MAIGFGQDQEMAPEEKVLVFTKLDLIDINK